MRLNSGEWATWDCPGIEMNNLEWEMGRNDKDRRTGVEDLKFNDGDFDPSCGVWPLRSIQWKKQGEEWSDVEEMNANGGCFLAAVGV